MSGNIAFAVPKDRLSVIIRLEKEASLKGDIFLEYVSETTSMHQKVTAFLEQGNAFFPIKLSSGITEFVNKTHVRYVAISLPDDPNAQYFSFRPMQAIRVNALFGDGEAIRGELLAEVPAEKTRLSDCLNMQNNFLSVKSDDKICYINKESLQKVVHADGGM
jgi:hypothetical protein